MGAEDVARAHYRARQRIAAVTAARAQGIWDRFDVEDLAGSYARAAVALIEEVTPAQQAAAALADDYLDELVDVAAAGTIDPAAFAGVASDGRRLDTLLFQPVIATRVRLAGGATLDEAIATGRFTLGRIVHTQVTDAGRVAVGAGITARHGVGYVRMLVPPSCARCAVLAGKPYRWNAGFQRHPHCDCVHIPAREADRSDLVRDLRLDTDRYFHSLTTGDQDRIFTTAGARAIREGADVGQVVNARRGMAAAGTTTEGITRHGSAGRQLRGRTRLMPERIYQVAGDDRDEAIRLLVEHGYLA